MSVDAGSLCVSAGERNSEICIYGAVVGERFGEIGAWASAITESVLDGPPAVGRVRTCQVAGFGPIAAGVIKERLTEFDPQTRSLSYEAAAGMPWFITGAVSRWRCTPGRARAARCGSTPR
jgi:hypothetical protein